MKLKARDIIAGWPRGRSTLAAIDWREQEIFRMHWPPQKAFEYFGDRVYHQGQQLMLDNYFEQWRQPPPDPFERMTWALVRGRQV